MRAHGRKISVIGLGYVGLPVAVAFGKRERTIGFDVHAKRVQELTAGIDRTHEVTPEDLKSSNVVYTADPSLLKEADFHIVAVPTPVDDAHRPDLTPLLRASETVGKALKRGDIVVFESTVYPGATEEECVPLLERHSGLRFGDDFTVGYSPERINPGDKLHTFDKIRKVVSGSDAHTLDVVASVYESVVTAGVHRATSVKVAEAAKVIENTQRDLNIALMNELAVIFELMQIDTLEVLEAAGTKWNFLKFYPGLVGGHCIGVDPYYLTHKAERLGYISQVILAGRRINDGMGRFIAQQTIKQMVRAGTNLCDATVTVLGLTFKENCPDIRNTRVVDIVRELNEYGVRTQLHDPLANAAEAQHEYQVSLTAWEDLAPADAVVVAVAHDFYRAQLPEALTRLARGRAVVSDVRGVLSRRDVEDKSMRYWRL